MWHTIFHIIDRIEHSLREHNIAWFAGMGSVFGMSALVIGVLIQGGTFVPFTALFESGNEPAVVIGARGGDVIENTIAPEPTEEPQVTPQAPELAVIEETELFEPLPPTAVLIGEPVVRVAVGTSYTDDGALLPDGEDAPISLYLNGMRVDEVFVDTSVPGEHSIEYRPRVDGAGSTFRTVIVE